MKIPLALGVALIVLINIVEILPTSKAPESNQESFWQANFFESVQNTPDEPKNTTEPLDKPLVLNLLDLYVEQQRDLPKAESILEQTPPTPETQHLLELYRAKVLSRTLQFEQAEVLLNQLNQDDLPLLKAAVLIALNDRDKSGAYLHGLVESHPDPNIKSKALALLNTYHEYDQHRDTDESYLWTLFAKQLAEFGELEISLYLTEKAISNNEAYRDAWLIKGHDEFQLKNYQDAETSLLTAYQLDPGNAQIQYLLGLTYHELGNRELSDQYLLYSLKNNQKYQPIIWDILAQHAVVAEDYALASYYYTQLLQHDPSRKHALSELVKISGDQLGQSDQAELYAQQVIDEYPDDPLGYELMSWVQTQKNELEQARMYLEQSQQLK